MSTAAGYAATRASPGGPLGVIDVRDQLPQARDIGAQLLALAHRQLLAEVYDWFT